jgi:hypothetical protein
LEEFKNSSTIINAGLILQKIEPFLRLKKITIHNKNKKNQVHVALS